MTSLLAYASRFANDAILVLDADGRLVEANERFGDMYGYEPAELAGLDVAALRSEASRATLAEDWRRATEQGAVTFETEHRRKDGTPIPVEVSTRAVDWEGRRYWVSHIRDIGERRAAAARIARLAHLYRTVTAAHQALLHSATADEVFRRICATATEFGLKMAWIGLAEGDTIRPVTWSGAGSDYLDGLVITVDPAAPTSWGPTGTAVRLGRAVICNDFQHDDRTAPWHDRARAYGWGASAAFPLFRQDRPVGTLSIYSGESGFFGPDEISLLDDLALDISFMLDRLETEARKDALEAALQRSVDQLADANIELERFNEIYSHDLQEPIRSVVSFSQLLERRAGAQLDAESRATLKTVVDAALRIGQLNRDLQAFSRSRHADRPFAAADSARALQYACGEFHDAIAQAGARICIQPLPRVLGSDEEVRQLFVALLSNALKFASPDRPLSIEVEAEPEGEFWHFTVRDNGIGIEADYLEKVFGIFVRLHPSSAYPGSGVGLAITRKIVERLGGKVWLESEPGVGTTVHFLLKGVTPA